MMTLAPCAPTSLRRLTPALLLALASYLVAGCKKSDSRISSGQFLAPVASEGPAAVTVLAGRDAFLKAIRPDASKEDLENIRPESIILGRLSIHDEEREGTPDPDDEVDTLDEYLVYEGKTRSLLSATRCGDQPEKDCSVITLHYDGRGFDDAMEGRQGGLIASKVQPLELQGGWILAFENGNQNLVAFRKEKPRTVLVAGPGGPQAVEVAYRPFDDTADKNFGAGNGLIVSVVVGIEELLTVVGSFNVAHLLEIEKNKVLVFFSSSTQDIHLLELREEDRELPFDLEGENVDPFECDPAADVRCLKVKLLKGTFRLFPENPADPRSPKRPLLPGSRITQATGGVAGNISAFRPVCLTTCEDGDSPGGDTTGVCESILLFDEVSSSFLDLRIERSGGEITGASIRPLNQPQAPGGAEPQLLQRVLTQALGQSAKPPFRFQGAFCHPSTTEVAVFEDATNTLLLIDYTREPGEQNIRYLVNQRAIQSRRDPSGQERGPGTPEDPRPVFSQRDVRDNRIFFNQGPSELQSLSYRTGIVTLVLPSSDISASEIRAVGNFVFIDPDPSNDGSLRVLDQQTNSLLDIRVQYDALPVKIR